jgi:D-sedoheptulose 7-phosphate isomerase
MASGPMADDAAVTAIRGLIGESVAVQKAVAQGLAPAILETALLVARVLAGGGKLLIFGNGGSAADAEHMAAELVGRFERERPGLPAIALTANSAVLTALGNDFGQEEIFARQIEALGKPGDVAIAVSTSGRSPNVVAAAGRARTLGLRVVALTGADGGDLRPLADICVPVPSSSVARIQEAHRIVIHAICSVVDGVAARQVDPEAERTWR